MVLIMKIGQCVLFLYVLEVLSNLNVLLSFSIYMGGAVASWLARWTPVRALRVRALAGDIVLCSWARHFTLTVPLSTQVGNDEFNAGG